MRYDYGCKKCNYEFEVDHGMKEKPKVKCPKCSSIDTEIIFRTIVQAYIRGYGYCDREGCRRDMNLHTLRNNDPYGYMRQRGEKDDMINNLKKAGKHNPKRKHFITKK